MFFLVRGIGHGRLALLPQATKRKPQNTMTKKYVKKLAAVYGATVEVYATDDGFEIAVVAPDGKHWCDGPGVLLGHFGGTWGKASEAWIDLADRIEYGTQDD